MKVKGKSDALAALLFGFVIHALAQAPSVVVTPRLITPTKNLLPFFQPVKLPPTNVVPLFQPVKPALFGSSPPSPPPTPLPTPLPPPVASGIICGPSGNIRVASTERFYYLVFALARAFASFCPLTSLDIMYEATDSAAVKQVCGARSMLGDDMAFLGRPLNASEATTADGINFQCLGKNKTATTTAVLQIPVAVDTVVVTARLGGTGANCISSLPGGGLTLHQLRWIYSNYTINQLKSTGWPTNALPNSDNLDTTHLWSELCKIGTTCSAFCPSQEIKLIGPSSSSDVVSFLLSKTISDSTHGEGLATSRYTQTVELGVVPQVSVNSFALGLVDFSLFKKSLAYAASVQQIADSNFYVPCKGTSQNGLYPLTRYVFMDVASYDVTIRARIRPFAKFILSQTGDSIVVQKGFVPLSNVDKVTAYSRLADGSRRQLSPVSCGPSGPIAATGDPQLYNLAASWAGYYTTFCRSGVITATKSSNSLAAEKICGDASKGPILDIALMTRRLNPSEATLQRDRFTYKCVKDPNKRNVIEVTVATNGAALKYLRDPNGAASRCIDSLGGLTVDQVRWMFSSFSTAQLIATGWNPTSIPNSDGNDKTHLWSELGGKNCRATEILVAGPPTSSTTFELLRNVALSGNGETIALNRPNVYFNGQDSSCPNGYPQGNPDAVTQYLTKNSDAIALLDFSDGLVNLDVSNTSRSLLQDSLATVSIKNAAGQFVPPNASSLADCSYRLCQPLYAYVNQQFSSLGKTSQWLQFGYSSTGDAIVKSLGLNPVSTAMKTIFLKRLQG